MELICPQIPRSRRHYLCGELTTKTVIAILGLWTLGETACTGLHGPPFGLKFLLECLAMAHFQENCDGNGPHWKYQKNPHLGYPQQTDADEMIVITHVVRRLM